MTYLTRSLALLSSYAYEGPVASLPAASAFRAGKQAWLSDVGTSAAGSVWITDGANWRPLGGSCVVAMLAAQVGSITNAGNSALISFNLPVNLPNGADIIFDILGGKASGTSNIVQHTVSIGGTTIISNAVVCAAANLSGGARHGIKRVNATTIAPIRTGAASAATGWFGTNTVAAALTATTVPDMDSATRAFAITANMSGATDTGYVAECLAMIVC